MHLPDIQTNRALYDEMLPRGIVPDTITFNSMIDGFCIQNRLDAG